MSKSVNLGIFWVVEGRIFYKQERVVVQGEKILDSSLSHYAEWERLRFLKGDFATNPRGRVLFDPKNDIFHLYVDKCITDRQIKEIIRIFALDRYKICYDEHYHCDKCIDEVEI